MYKSKNSKAFGERIYEKDSILLRSAAVVDVEQDPALEGDDWHEGAVPVPAKTRGYKYRGQGGLHPEQEWLLFLTYIHHNVPNSFLAERWLNCPCQLCSRIVRNIICLWTSAMYAILRLESFWCDPDRLQTIADNLKAESSDTPALYRGDCTCTPLQGHAGGEKGRSKDAANGLWGHYYHVHGAKFCIISGPNGSTLAVSTTFGAGTSDRQIMNHMNLFDPKAYKRKSCTCDDRSCQRCKEPVPFFYDCAAFSMTSDFLSAGVDPILSGQKRASADQCLPYEVKSRCQTFAQKRIRIECVIGILKKRFPILCGPIPQWLAPLVHKIVYVCCMLSNFCHPTISNWEEDDNE